MKIRKILYRITYGLIIAAILFAIINALVQKESVGLIVSIMLYLLGVTLAPIFLFFNIMFFIKLKKSGFYCYLSFLFFGLRIQYLF